MSTALEALAWLVGAGLGIAMIMHDPLGDDSWWRRDDGDLDEEDNP